jgi:transaldolase
VLYIRSLSAPLTVNTMPEATLVAFGDHGDLAEPLTPDGGDSESILSRFSRAGVDVKALAARLQDQGAKSFVSSWNELMAVISSKSASLRKAG